MGPKKTLVFIIAVCFLAAANSQSSCPAGYVRDWAGRCVPDPSPCPPGQRKDINGRCVSGGPGTCPAGQIRDPISGQCVNAGCPPGQTVDIITGQCIKVNPWPAQWCPFRDPVTGQCIDPTALCPPGYRRDRFTGQCVLNDPQQCPLGMSLDPFTGQCYFNQNWLCSLCSECCYSNNAYQRIFQCYFDYQGNFEGCLQQSGFSTKSVSNLIGAENNPKFVEALRSLGGANIRKN